MMAAARKPSWLRIRPPKGGAYEKLRSIISSRGLYTVCQGAHCPNSPECWSVGTAAFMVMGEVCTRACRFCAVPTSARGTELDPEEPMRLANAVEELGLEYVVITSVDRDDLKDGGAGHFAKCIEAVKKRYPSAKVEALIPDFHCNEPSLREIAFSLADVVAHNLETVKRLQRRVRDPRAGYEQSLRVLRLLKELNPALYTKSSLMLGLGETDEEVREALRDLRDAGVEMLTIGQYLQPSPRHLPVVEYLPPERFEELAKLGTGMGFVYCASGPFVRSSYRAGEFFLESILRRGGREVAH